MQLSFGPRRLQVIAVASIFLVLYINGPIVAHADDGGQPADQPADQCGGANYDQCQSNQSAQTTNPTNQTNYGSG